MVDNTKNPIDGQSFEAPKNSAIRLYAIIFIKLIYTNTNQLLINRSPNHVLMLIL